MSTLQERTNPRLREVLVYLANSGGTAFIDDVLRHVEPLIPPSGEELERVTNGSTRWANALLWQTTGLVKANWLLKDGRGNWTITDKGRMALERIPQSRRTSATRWRGSIGSGMRLGRLNNGAPGWCGARR